MDYQTDTLETIARELRPLTEDFTMKQLDDAIWLDRYSYDRKSSRLKMRIDLMVREYGLINVMNCFDLMKRGN